MIKLAVFDLDGTLTDSGPGIMNGFEYSLEKMGFEYPDRDFLKQFVGPPLSESFEKSSVFLPKTLHAALHITRNTMPIREFTKMMSIPE